MNTGTITIGVLILIVTIFIYTVKNFQSLLNLYNYNKDKKSIKITVYLVIIFSILMLAILVIIYVKESIENVQKYIFSIENDKNNEEYDQRIIEENNFYKAAMEKEYIGQASKNPYIPENFSYMNGEWDTGFVIQDANENQYVWVPCTNKENDEITLLQRKNFTNEPFIAKEICNNENYENFINSALENGGFYISRFEIGEEDGNIVSKNGVEVLTNLNKEEAKKMINEFNYDINCELINGYAYDTTQEWILKTNKVELGYNNVNEKIISGKKSYNNIYDFFDNTLEITTEKNYGTVIIRGVFLKNFTMNNNTDISIDNFDRISILENEKFFSDGSTIGLRTIIYK